MGQAWVSVHPTGDVRTHACLSCPVSNLSLGASQLTAFMETANAIPRKQPLRNWKSQDWIEHPSFGLGQAIRESRGQARHCFSEPWQENASQVDGTPIRRLTASPNPDFKFPRAQQVFPNLAPSSHPSPRPSTIVPQLSNEGDQCPI